MRFQSFPRSLARGQLPDTRGHVGPGMRCSMCRSSDSPRRHQTNLRIARRGQIGQYWWR
jgi:hypothetical protein